MQALYMEDSYLKEFEADVVSVKDGKFVVLDKTAFYPNSGGQPHDTGMMTAEDGAQYNVVFTGKFSGQISHEVDKEGLKQGDKVKCALDWDRRYKLMRMHTAAHLLCSFFHKKAGALITGNQLNIEKSRIDFSLDDFDREKINEYVRDANDVVQKGVEVKTYTLPREEAMKIPDVVKLANALPPSIKELRIVEIEGVDTQADGGTHVKNTSEIGTISLLKAENKGKNNRRIYYKVE